MSDIKIPNKIREMKNIKIIFIFNQKTKQKFFAEVEIARETTIGQTAWSSQAPL